MWYLFQGSIMFAVLASNIHWHWSRNVYVASFAAWIATAYATVTVLRVQEGKYLTTSRASDSGRRLHFLLIRC
jgi:uncharacterized protein (DUF2141 family)